jgi:muramidase (phage lysozyme)
MTIGEILDYQNRIDEFDPDINSEAMGRYQFVEDTLRGFNNDEYNTLSLAYKGGKGEKPVYEKAGLTKSDLFNAQNQDLLAIERLKFRGLNDFLDNKTSIVFYANKLSAEWASLPIVSGIHAGKSTYAGDGINKATGDIQEVLDTLKALNPKWEDFYK